MPACIHIPVRVEPRAHPVPLASRPFTLVPEGSGWVEPLTLDQGTILKDSFVSVSDLVHSHALSMGLVLDIHLTGVFALLASTKVYGQVYDKLKKKAIIGKNKKFRGGIFFFFFFFFFVFV